MKPYSLLLSLALVAVLLTAAACSTPAPSNLPFGTPTLPGLALGSTITGGDGAVMLFVPAGDFVMGSTDQQVADYVQQAQSNINCIRCSVTIDQFNYEKPQHLVYLDAYWIDKYNVTNALYKKCSDAGKCSPPVPNSSNDKNTYFGDSKFEQYPVIWVSWDDATSYCAWAGKRLPTEAEWEKAARGSGAQIYPWGNTYDDKMRSQNQSVDAVDGRPANVSPYGIVDMVGNVTQWVSDWYSDTHYSHALRRDPPGPQPFLGLPGDRVMRGGGWMLPEAYEQRAARRFHTTPVTRDDYIGFRCAKDYVP